MFSAQELDAAVALLQEKAHAGAWWCDLGARNVRWSAGLYRLFGIDPRKVAPDASAFLDLVHPDDRGALEQALRDPVREIAVEPTVRIIRGDGELRWLRLANRLVHDRDGTPTHIIGVALDVTSRHHAEAGRQRQSGQIEAMHRLVRLLLNQTMPAAAGSLRWHRSGSADQGWDAAETIHPDDRAMVAEHWTAAMRQAGDYAVAFRRLLPTGGHEVAVSLAVPVTDGSGRIEDWLGVTGRAGVAERTDAAGDMLTPALLRAARAYLGWTSERLAQRSLLSLSTIRRMEAGQAASLSADNRRAVVAALTEGGVRIVVLPGGGVAVAEAAAPADRQRA